MSEEVYPLANHYYEGGFVMKQKLKKLAGKMRLQNEKGQGTAEYILLLAIVVGHGCSRGRPSEVF